MKRCLSCLECSKAEGRNNGSRMQLLSRSPARARQRLALESRRHMQPLYERVALSGRDLPVSRRVAPPRYQGYPEDHQSLIKINEEKINNV
ncbi:hypothetical protein Taro_015220 [Colocasia esculenta]|uniref:Uncharacterized protein n=1 Tax=Colocasia esculenta TaxID=4460 RepID=A0A843UGS4_COLES|nr:hypothetical protein [Colocasia esculenta]